MASLNKEMRNLERLERERREMATKIDELGVEQASRKSSMEMNKNAGDLNMKLKMEIGALRGENEGLVRRSEETRREIGALEEQIQVSLDLSLTYDTGESCWYLSNKFLLEFSNYSRFSERFCSSKKTNL